jgi:transketolase
MCLGRDTEVHVMRSTRDAYGEELLALGERRPDLFVVDADLSCSTMTSKFAVKFPQRFMNVGCSEQDLMGTAAGLAIAGKTVFASTHASFATGRPWDQIRTTIAHDGLNVKIAATHAGLTNSVDGYTHHSLEDIALMRVIPGMGVIVPADYYEAKSAVNTIGDAKGPFYLRLSRTKTPLLFQEGYKLDMGTMKAVHEVGNDCLIVATGIMVAESVSACKELEADGVKCTVLNASVIKPFDVETLVKYAKATGAVVTTEEHSVVGGLGSLVSETLSERYPVLVRKVGVKDRFTSSGSPEELYNAYGLTKADIIQAVKDTIKKK